MTPGPTGREPVYSLQDCRELRRRPGGFVSPYTHQRDESGVLVGALPDAGGGFMGLLDSGTSPGGTGLLNHAGTDLIRVDAAGNPLWDHPLPEHKGLEGLQGVGPVVLTGVGATCEVLAFNRDGLGLGSFGFRPEVHYPGFFLDHPRIRAYRGADNRIYALVADNFNGMQHWYRLHGDEAIVSTATALTLADPAAHAAGRAAGSARRHRPSPRRPRSASLG